MVLPAPPRDAAGEVAAAPAPIFGVDRDLRVTEWNRAAEELTGIQAGTAVRRARCEIGRPFLTVSME